MKIDENNRLIGLTPEEENDLLKECHSYLAIKSELFAKVIVENGGNAQETIFDKADQYDRLGSFFEEKLKFEKAAILYETSVHLMRALIGSKGEETTAYDYWYLAVEYQALARVQEALDEKENAYINLLNEGLPLFSKALKIASDEDMVLKVLYGALNTIVAIEPYLDDEGTDILNNLIAEIIYDYNEQLHPGSKGRDIDGTPIEAELAPSILYIQLFSAILLSNTDEDVDSKKALYDSLIRLISMGIIYQFEGWRMVIGDLNPRIIPFVKEGFSLLQENEGDMEKHYRFVSKVYKIV